MARAVWKGAITFGLVHLPVSLHPATQDSGIDFDWLDRKTLDPVGYKRYNKRTGRELKAQDIVKGVKQPGGRYVVLSDEEIKAAFPKTTQTIDIQAFVEAAEVPPFLFERPYYVEPSGKADKVYLLLRDAMRAAEVIAIARIVMHTKEHLAALMVSGPLLMLVTLRWAAQLRSPDSLGLPQPRGAGANIKSEERQMAAQLIGQMTTAWKPEAYTEHFGAAIRSLLKKKSAAGETKSIAPLESVSDTKDSNIIDLRQLLAESVRKHKASGREAAGRSRARGARRRSA